ncbi:hypothetical protein ACFO9Q_18995 [Paenibacillus sp. GCM10023252]|uniref:hypothetical protein n=1 Tax=Paenibacillus sp. GCM10023252 TaxID=3252649 RepID=UPI0036078336
MNNNRAAAAASLVVMMLLSAACGGAGSGAKPVGGTEHGEHSGNHDSAEHQHEKAGRSNGSGGSGIAGGSGGSGTADDEWASSLQAVWTTVPPSPKAKEKATLQLSIEDAEGMPVDKYELNHEKLMHLIIVSEDLQYFDHVHPEYEGEGRFTVDTTLPSGGRYKLFADFVPSGAAAPITKSSWMEVGGGEQHQHDHGAHSLQPDYEQTKVVQGAKIGLTLSSTKAGDEAEMMFTLEDEETGKPITTLEPYLGALGHVVVVSEDTEQYLHSHPISSDGSGPEAAFHTTWPANSGLYRIWGQFQWNGEVLVVPFTVKVE